MIGLDLMGAAIDRAGTGLSEALTPEQQKQIDESPPVTADERAHAPAGFLSPASTSTPAARGGKAGAGPGDRSAPSTSSGVTTFLSKVIVGPVKVWHALAGAVAAGAGVLIYRHTHRKKAES